MTEQELVEKVAIAISGAPFPTTRSLNKARAAISVIREAEFTVVPSDIRRAFYYPIEMPVTADGHGPATVGVDAVKITYEVWDCLLNSHGSHDNLPDAINQAIALNSRAMIAASPIGEK